MVIDGLTTVVDGPLMAHAGICMVHDVHHRAPLPFMKGETKASLLKDTPRTVFSPQHKALKMISATRRPF